jgi:hypothetical protein
MVEFGVVRKIGKWTVRIVGVLSLITIIPIAFKVREYGYVTTRLTARVVCPMVYIDGRDTSFALNYLNMIGIVPFDPRSVVSVELNPKARETIVTAYGMFEARSIHYPGEGCVMQ